MIIYLFLLLIPTLLGCVYTENRQKQKSFFGLWLYFIVLLVFIGLRYQIGPDWNGYELIFDNYSFNTLDEVGQFPEPGFFLLNKFSDYFGLGLQGVIFFGSFIFLYGCFRYARSTSNPWISLAVVLPYLGFIIAQSGIRQSIAIGLGFYLLSVWSNSSLVEKLLIVLLAISFHNSAAIFLIFIVLSSNKSYFWKGVLAVSIFTYIFYNLNQSIGYEKYRSVYVDQGLVSEGAFFHVLLNAIPALIYVVLRKKMTSTKIIYDNVMIGSILTLGLMSFILVASTGVDRLVLYFSFVQMSVYPALLKNKIFPVFLLKFSIVLLILSIFFIYFLFGAHSSSYIPYKNFLISSL